MKAVQIERSVGTTAESVVVREEIYAIRPCRVGPAVANRSAEVYHVLGCAPFPVKPNECQSATTRLTTLFRLDYVENATSFTRTTNEHEKILSPDKLDCVLQEIHGVKDKVQQLSEASAAEGLEGSNIKEDYDRIEYLIPATVPESSARQLALDQVTMCGEVSPVVYGPWTEELKILSVKLSDAQYPSAIELLLEADVAEYFYTGGRRELPCGLVAVEIQVG
ncbi:hypothetical protein FQR65_LT05846 [Abscondita terminalis]|nr:hypothetical protein FQR65_LT05846 [Abscondita terminalis]